MSTLDGPPHRQVAEVVARLTAVPGREGRLRHLEVVAPRAAVSVPWPDWVSEDVRAAFVRTGVSAPWQHQAAAADAARAGQHVVLATGTASGKSLAYQVPALTAIRESRGRRGERGAGVLYLAPTKALANDQLSGIAALGLDVRVATHDGDSTHEQRDWTRDYGEYVLTNPDMLHHSLLPRHAHWAPFFGSLRYVVIDECHHYRGVFGAHVAHVLRRLRRICAMYGAYPTFILASATVAEPEVAAGRLTGLDVLAITADHSPRGQVSLLLWEPPFTSYAGENGAPVRRAASSEVAELLADLVAEDVRTLAFVRSRRGAEQVAATAAELLADVDPSLPGRVASYRGGYLPEERRELEAALRRGDLTGLAATNALELGIDISGLDAVLIAGFPGTRAALWQQIGRAGRDAQDALGVLVAGADPLDTYLVNHPESLLGQPVEATVFDPSNPYVLGPHLCAAAQEHPLAEADLPLFGDNARLVVDQLTEAGLLRKRPRGWFWTDRRRASDLADIRSSGGAQVQLIESETGRVIGTVDASSSHGTAHAGAVYVHRGETWLVESLDLEEHVASMHQADLPYSTSAREITDISIVAEREHRSWGDCRLSLGEVDVSHQVVSFLKRRQPGGEVIGEELLDLPERSLRTCAVWWTVPGDVLTQSGLVAADVPGAAHAAEHCSIGLLPLFATCDRWDIGGVSTAMHADTGRLTVFVYDGHPGGAGFAERGFRAAHDWLTATRETIAGCECASGCPSCIQSPKCGNQNNPLDKDGAIALLDLLLVGARAE
ncbi:DEAD/DEAH box helicase [Nocardioides sp.]|uniref:DEAD/DEAH box helicase n=1 Tax=Nocardioides sp. TaxID=35761 RepID=UPI00286D8C7C|nr:DEAD/DEAH box helicase [Nocardioides sp.]